MSIQWLQDAARVRLTAVLRRSPAQKYTWVIVTLCTAFTAGLLAPAQAIEARIILTTGQSQYAEISSVTKSGVMWSTIGSDVPPRVLAYEKIDRVDFPEPDFWLQANQDFNRGNYQKAVARFLEIANNRKGHYYPTPGNYASLATMRIIDCCRELGQPEKIVPFADKLDPQSLTSTERNRWPLVQAWSALGKGEWQAALDKADAFELTPLQTGSADRGYIRGLALEKLGKPAEAIMAYAEAYTFEFGSRGALPKKALQQSITLLESLEQNSRRTELHAMVHTYAHAFDEGHLWEDAGPVARDLLAESLDITTDIETQKSKQRGPVINIRFRQKEIVHKGKKRTFTFQPQIPALTNRGLTSKQLLTSATVKDMTLPGINLTIKSGDSSQGITWERNNGMGIILKREKKTAAPINQSAESLIFSMTGVEAFKVVALTFGGGNASYEFNKTDAAKLTVSGLKEGEPKYPKTLSGTAPEAEDTPASPAFRRIPLDGGFIKESGGHLKLEWESGSFGLDAIALELKMKEQE